MNATLRKNAEQQGMSLMDFILSRMNWLKTESGVPRTILAVCPNSMTVIKAALRSSKRNNAPIKFAATLNQVDRDGGYTGLTPAEFVHTIRQEAEAIHLTSPVIIAIDHGGPWLKDLHTREQWSYENSMDAVKKSFEAAIEAGYDLIHVDPTIDITLPKGAVIDIKVVVSRTVELIAHAEEFRTKNNYPRIAYEVGTEEVHGGLADFETFYEFLTLLKEALDEVKLGVWPCFVVGKVGTDLHTTMFDPIVALELSDIARSHGSLVKGHYSDNVSNPKEYPNTGMGAANVGPEFTEREYEGLIELCEMEEDLFAQRKVVKPANLKTILWEAVIDSQRWKKWLQEGESADDFYQISDERQEWLIKTGCRYIWENPKVVSARHKLYRNLFMNGVNGEEIVLARIEQSIDKYFYNFNLVDLNNLIAREEPNLVDD